MKKVKDAVASETVFTGAKFKGLRTVDEITTALNAVIPASLSLEDVVFLCVGTDRSTGDSLGPYVGTYLKGLGYTNVIGTLDEPCHAMNLVDCVGQIPEGKKVIAIDACLGQFSSVGSVAVINGSLKPGGGVNKTHLPYVGDYSISGVVNVGGFMEYFVLQNTRLSVVVEMAKNITSALVNIMPLGGSRIMPFVTVDISKPEKKRGRPRKVKPTEALI